jgi:hypothetical protein
MVELFLKLIDRLIDLLERQKKSKRAIFTDHIEPLFTDLAQIHSDYLTSLNEIAELINDPARSGLAIRFEVAKRQRAFAPLRAKVAALSKAISAADFDKPIKDFADEVCNYFVIATEDEDLVRPSAYSATLRFLDWVLWERGRIRARSRILTVIACIDVRWARLTEAYANIRLHLLAP